jgi:hypothetical protein
MTIGSIVYREYGTVPAVVAALVRVVLWIHCGYTIDYTCGATGGTSKGSTVDTL